MVGENMRSVWSAAVKEFVNLGFGTAEGADEVRAELAEEIRSVG